MVVVRRRPVYMDMELVQIDLGIRPKTKLETKTRQMGGPKHKNCRFASGQLMLPKDIVTTSKTVRYAPRRKTAINCKSGRTRRHWPT